MFVDLAPSSRDHSVCDADNWVDGLFTSVSPLQVAVVHPDATGHRNAADHVSAAILDALGVN